MIWLVLYLIVYVFTVRHVTGWVVHNIITGPLDGEAMVLALLFGLVVSSAWPVVILGRVCYILGRKYGPSDRSLFLILFPAPKPVETRKEREARLESERRKEINSREQELGMELTKW